MANCQFKNLRENSLLSKLQTESHAREIQSNHHGGIDIIKNLKFEQFKYISNLHQLVPTRHFANGDPNPKRAKKSHKKGKGKNGGSGTNADGSDDGSGNLNGKKKECGLDHTIQVVNGQIVDN